MSIILNRFFKYSTLFLLPFLKLCYLFFPSRTSVRVLTYHHIDDHQIEGLRKQILRLGETWEFIDPQTFDQYMRGEVSLEGRFLLITFDDGFASAALAAKKVLNPLGLKAIFFVCSDFVGFDDAMRVSSAVVADKLNLEAAPPMLSSNDASEIIAAGHSIGCHTASHENLASLSLSNTTEKEIVGAKLELEERFNIDCLFFCWPFGTLECIDQKSLSIAFSAYRYVFSGFRGNNACRDSGRVIARDSISVNDSWFLTEFYLLGGFDWIYRPRLFTCDSWGK